MSKAKIPKKVKLVCGFIFSDPSSYEKAKSAMVSKYGPHDLESREMEFVHTDYYEQEMGAPLKKRLLSFEEAVMPDALADIKIFTNKVESELAAGEKRTVNIDPGILNLSRLILASSKDFAHRIYLRDGIFAEVTLRYSDKRFTVLPWTYPDFATREYLEILEKIRDIYANQLKNALL